jgi:hypothetical protein
MMLRGLPGQPYVHWVPLEVPLSQIKGSNMLNRQAFVLDRFDAAAWQRVLSTLPPQDAARLSPRILASGWYPFELYNALDQAICDALAGGDLDLCRLMGADSARRALSGTYRVYLKEGPEPLLRRLALLHRTFYDSGSMEVTHLTTGQCAIRAVYVPRSTHTNCLVAQGFYRTVVEMSGGRQVQVSEGNCSADGAPLCLFNIRWQTALDLQAPA